MEPRSPLSHRRRANRRPALRRRRIGESGPRRALRLPSLEATNSRINFKNGAEKLPFSLVNADLSLWQASPGEWRIRLRGQPARTDVSLYQEETGVVRMEASVHSAPALRADAAAPRPGLAPGATGPAGAPRRRLRSRLARRPDRRAARGWHRRRRARSPCACAPQACTAPNLRPPRPLDFDANCGFVYHYTRRSLENLTCNSPLGDGRMRLTGEKPGPGAPSAVHGRARSHSRRGRPGCAAHPAQRPRPRPRSQRHGERKDRLRRRH